jgi:hypothetical protein
VDWVHRRQLTGLRASLNASRWFSNLRPRSITAKGYLQVLILDIRARSDGGAVGSDWGRRGLVLTAACHGQAWQLTGVQVFSSHGGRFPMRFAPMGSQRWGELDKANLNRRRAATESGNGEVARLVLGDGEGGLRWSYGSQDVRRGFLELPSSFSTDQLLRMAAEKLKFGGYLGFGGFLTCGWKFALWVALYIGFLDRIVVSKDSNLFLIWIKLYLTKIQKKSKRG